MDDPASVREVLIDSIRKSPKSRAQIAEEMTGLAGRRITERMLNGFTAESRDDYRFPLELARAFCSATGDHRLIRLCAERAGCHVIDDTEAEVLELGRQYLRRKAADESIALLEKRLHGRHL